MKFGKMNRLLLHLIATLLIFIIIACASTGQPRANEKDLLGLWNNLDYDRFAETDIKPNLFPGRWLWRDLTDIIGKKIIGVFAFSRSTDDDWITIFPHEYKITKKWTDDLGASYFQFTWLWWFVSETGATDGFDCYILLKLSSDKQYFEFMLSREEVPSAIDKDDASYHIYYRE